MEPKKNENVQEAVKFDTLIQRAKALHIFRGLADEAFQLIPSIEHKGNKAQEQEDLKEFKERLEAEGYFNQPLIHNDFRTLGLAQHVQYCPTRFLDWTSNILIALRQINLRG